ncbi:hypothetical protein AN161_22075 [Lysinibacillus sp. FJAT-14222]|nr:hypothetical protein AN161_22075 [Lysinibacillus sp. FJAT-14222]
MKVDVDIFRKLGDKSRKLVDKLKKLVDKSRKLVNKQSKVLDKSQNCSSSDASSMRKRSDSKAPSRSGNQTSRYDEPYISEAK